MTPPLTARLDTEDGHVLLALPVHMDGTELCVAVPWSVAPRIEDGSVIAVTLIAPGIRAWSGNCVVAEQINAWDALELRLAWAAPGEVHLAMPGCYRELADECALLYGSQPKVSLPHTRTHVLDLSANCVTIEVPDSFQGLARHVWEGELALSDGKPPTRFHGRVSDTRETTSHQQVTLRFVGTDGALRQLDDRITAWLLAHRRRELHRAGDLRRAG